MQAHSFSSKPLRLHTHTHDTSIHTPPLPQAFYDRELGCSTRVIFEKMRVEEEIGRVFDPSGARYLKVRGTLESSVGWCTKSVST